MAAPAAAQVGASVSLFSDARLRGFSLSDGRPVASLDLAYDDPSGFYLGGSARAVVRRGGSPAPLGIQLDGGYAVRFASGTSLDLGVTHSSYSDYSSNRAGASYTEVYAGISRGVLLTRIFLSPHYFARRRWTAYGEVAGNIDLGRRWTITAHAGTLVPLRSPENRPNDPLGFDWSIGVTKALGRLALHATFSDAASGRDFYSDSRHGRSALVVGATIGL